MPNYCGNMLTLGHKNPEMIVRAKSAFARGELLQEFIPLPNGIWDREWAVENWGTKWDIGTDAGINTWDNNELCVYFDSAWSPPIGAYETLTNQGFTIYATWYEPGSAFAGIYDECGVTDFDLSGMDSQQVIDELPDYLDEQFGISESMAEYEAEQEDEVTRWYKDGVKVTGLEPHKVKDEQ